MTGRRGAPRTVEFFVLRVCERFGWQIREFDALAYDEQVRLLAYDQLRREDEATGWAEPG